MGFALTQAQTWLAKRSADIPEADRTFIAQSRKAARRRKRRVQALVGVLVAAIAVGRGGLVEPGLAEGRRLTRSLNGDRPQDRRRSAPSSRVTHSRNAAIARK